MSESVEEIAIANSPGQMNKTIIHIGIHKTASTFLQTQIFPKFKGFTLLTRPYTQHNSTFNKLQFADDTLYDAGQTGDELRSLGNNLLISDESFAGITLNCSVINRSVIAKRFSEIFPDASIVLFIRGQQDALVSNYHNYVENVRGTLSIEEFFWYPEREYSLSEYNYDYYAPYPPETLYINTNRRNFHLDELKYFNLIRLYKHYFKDVHVFLYEDFKKNQQKVLLELESIAGEELQDMEDVNVKKRVLKSLSPKDHVVKRIENYWLGFGNSVRKTRPMRYLARGMGLLSRPFLDPKAVEKDQEYLTNRTRSHYVSDNDLIIEHYPEIGIQHYPEKYLSSVR
jgi:hypothetical protein